jgi:hypothetical protein
MFSLLVGLLASVSLAAGCGSADQGDLTSSTALTSTSSQPLSSTTTTLSEEARVLARALTTQARISSYAFTLETWQMDDADAVTILSADGLVRRPWTYFEISASTAPGTTLYLALSDERRLARVDDSDWADAANAVPPALRELPLEDPDPQIDLIEGIAAKATLSSVELPSFAAPRPAEAVTEYTWASDLETGTAVAATVHTWAWLDARGRLIRLDRETIPVTGAVPEVSHTYTVLIYSRHADPTIEMPLPTELL